MIMTDVTRPGDIHILVFDGDEALDRDRFGIIRVATGDDGRVDLKGWDEFDHHSVILREPDQAGMDRMGFKVLDELTAKLELPTMCVTL